MVTIAVIGGRAAGEEELAAAGEVGRGIAEAGARLVCGGLGGVMEAACEGARSAGGLTIGLLPGTDRDAANPHVTVAIPTGLGEARNLLVVRTADAVVAIDGAYGTLSEIAFALNAGCPVVGLSTWELHRGGAPDTGIMVAQSPTEAVSLALEAARGVQA